MRNDRDKRKKAIFRRERNGWEMNGRKWEMENVQERRRHRKDESRIVDKQADSMINSLNENAPWAGS